MRKKIILSLFIIMVLLTNYSIAANITYTRTGGSSIKNIASVISDDIYVDWKYNATTNRVSNSNIEIYQYNQESDPTKKMISTGSSELIPYTGNENKYSLTTSDWNSSSASFGNANNAQYLFYTIKLPEGETSIRNVATFIYKDGISYDTQKYDVKMNIEEITKTEDVGNNNAFRALIGCREYSADNLIDIATYNKEIEPAIGVTAISPTNDGVEYGQVSGQVEVKVKYYILDKGNEIPISGLFKVADLDQNQGFALKEFTANNQNTYAKVLYDELEYKTIDNNAGIYMYSTVNTDLINSDIYLLISEKSSLDLIFTFDHKNAHSSVSFEQGVKRYKKIRTKVIGGTITDTISGIKDGETKKIEYEPNDSDKQYIKSITIDGENQNIDNTNINNYVFSNISEDHEIIVEYANKYKVTYDAKGGAPTPQTEYVIPQNKATKPTTNPTKKGYTFEEWIKRGETNPYNYDTPVTSDINLDAKWAPIKYKINYILNGGTNDKTNPPEYTVEDTINFQPATRDGYDFKGWYEDEALTNKKDGISNETGDKTVYAKWEAKSDVTYKVEHYKENDKGEYELVVTDSLTGTTNETVTATPKEYTGFTENKTHKDRIESGKIKADGSLVLKLYYDKNKYKVTFEPKNDTKIDDQIVKYQEKATEPTKPQKDGYEFKYWYYINEKNEEVKYDFDTPVTADINLIAKWEGKVAETPKTETKTVDMSNATTATKILPKTGKITQVITLLIMPAGIMLVVFGIKYIKLKNKMK